MNETPGTWKLSVDGFPVVERFYKFNRQYAVWIPDEEYDNRLNDAKHIIRCVNNFDSLVEALKDLLNGIENEEFLKRKISKAKQALKEASNGKENVFL